MRKIKYFTKQQLEQLGLAPASIENWARLFANTRFVIPPQPRLYSEDFLTFALTRTGRTGPSNLPDYDEIVSLYDDVRNNLTVKEMAEKRGITDFSVVEQLKLIGATDA